MSFPVHLDVFEGPLDLLLQLVSKDRVDVTEVSIGTITDDYLKAVEALGTIDLDTASSFLLLAATLLELKSTKLLPREPGDPDAVALLEERDRLLQRLVEYATFKAAAGALSSLLDAGEGYFTRTGGLPEEFRPSLPDPLAGVSLAQFVAIASKAFAPKVDPPTGPGGSILDTPYITPIRVSVGEMIELLLDELRRRPATSFRDLCQSAASRLDVVIRFLAVLELVRQSSVEVEQASPFDPITIRWRQPRIGTEPRPGIRPEVQPEVRPEVERERGDPR
ncbi:MAG: segregation and condensation protein A [Actinomycetota bacterium]